MTRRVSAAVDGRWLLSPALPPSGRLCLQGSGQNTKPVLGPRSPELPHKKSDHLAEETTWRGCALACTTAQLGLAQVPEPWLDRHKRSNSGGGER